MSAFKTVVAVAAFLVAVTAFTASHPAKPMFKDDPILGMTVAWSEHGRWVHYELELGREIITVSPPWYRPDLNLKMYSRVCTVDCRTEIPVLQLGDGPVGPEVVEMFNKGRWLAYHHWPERFPRPDLKTS